MSGDAGRDGLAILVHEVRSPVAALSAIAEAYRDAEPSDRRSLVGLALAACAGIERLISDKGVDAVAHEEIDLSRLATEAVDAAKLSGSRVRLDLESDLPKIRADRERLRQVLDNLISNALTHSPGTEEVIVGLRSSDGDLVVTVTDIGPGIPVVEHERIFEVGVRLDNTRSGSGLGLAISRAIVEAHGGTLTVASTSGSGTTFMVILPSE